MESSIERIETLVRKIESRGEPQLQDQVRELLQALLDMHGAALSHVLETVYEENGQAFIDRLATDELVGSVLMLHDLHPLGRTERVAEALESVKPYLASHGGNVELVDVRSDGTAVLRLEGSCNGCPSSSLTLRNTVEEAIVAAAPDVIAIEIEEPPATSDDVDDDFIPMSDLQWDDCPFPAEKHEPDTIPINAKL